MLGINKTALLEAVKELGRIIFLAALTAVIGWVTSKLSTFDPTSIYYIAGTALLKLVDKYIHKNDNISLKGITPF